MRGLDIVEEKLDAGSSTRITKWPEQRKRVLNPRRVVSQRRKDESRPHSR
jgi:hypothetical protein